MSAREGSNGSRGGCLWRLGRLVSLVPLVAAATACAPDILDMDVDLSPHAFVGDFGSATGTIPTIVCEADMPAACGSSVAGTAKTVAVPSADVPADVTVTPGCDTHCRCFAQANARIAYEVDVLQDDAFVTKVERGAIPAVRVLDLGYTVPKNTLTFDLPRIDVYAGPAGTKTENDGGAVFVDSIPTIAAGTAFVDERRHLTLADDSPARALIESSIQARTPFVLVLVAAPRLEAGAVAPAGAVEIDTLPSVRVGPPR
ncbi:MAG: hypothetical protein JWM82_4109 [Myxococcales bacterium]|nr:hypothetical protein [Myxococcales bacterium]